VFLILALILLIFLPSPWNVVVFLALLVLLALELAYWRNTVKRRRLQTGAETMIGSRVLVVADCRPEGEVWVEGARWKAHCDAGADRGDQVTIVKRDGLLLTVDPA
jgi:membrane protein implicated in regulation of membrane protease activity